MSERMSPARSDQEYDERWHEHVSRFIMNRFERYLLNNTAIQLFLARDVLKNVKKGRGVRLGELARVEPDGKFCADIIDGAHTRIQRELQKKGVSVHIPRIEPVHAAANVRNNAAMALWMIDSEAVVTDSLGLSRASFSVVEFSQMGLLAIPYSRIDIEAADELQGLLTDSHALYDHVFAAISGHLSPYERISRKQRRTAIAEAMTRGMDPRTLR